MGVLRVNQKYLSLFSCGIRCNFPNEFLKEVFHSEMSTLYPALFTDYKNKLHFNLVKLRSVKNPYFPYSYIIELIMINHNKAQ